MFDYSVKFEAIDKISAKISSINAKMAGLTASSTEASKKISAHFDKIGKKGETSFKKGVQALTGGVSFLAPLGKALGAYQDIARAKGEIASLGIDDAGIKSISKSAMEFSNTWAGTTTADFIRASYDIKSGIASLSDVDVGKFTALAGMTATATKSSTAEMTKLFALGHGIFREQFSSDVEFGNKFSSAISTAVQAFRTDGSDLVGGLSNLGASATAMGVSLQEQLAVLGMSKSAFNTASEGATSYRAFLNGAIKAQDKLGLSFVDNQGKLLPMADIMDKIRNKVQNAGLTMQDASVQQALSEAFGSQEATKMISALIGKTGELRKSQDLLVANMNKGTEVTEKMARAMQKGKEFELLGQKIQNAGAVIGGAFAPVALKIGAIIGTVTNKVKTWVEENPKLTSTLVNVALVIGGILTALGVFAVVSGVVGMAIGSLTTILGAFRVVMTAVKIATMLFNATLWANPITWIIAGIIALGVAIAGLIVYWNEVTQAVGWLWEKFKGFAIWVGGGLSSAFDGMINLFNTLIAPIKYVSGLIDSFLSKFEIFRDAKDAVVGVASDIGDVASDAWTGLKNFFGGDDDEENKGKIETVQKNHTVVDVNVVATGAIATEQKARTNAGRVKLNTASNGV